MFLFHGLQLLLSILPVLPSISHQGVVDVIVVIVGVIELPVNLILSQSSHLMEVQVLVEVVDLKVLCCWCCHWLPSYYMILADVQDLRLAHQQSSHYFGRLNSRFDSWRKVNHGVVLKKKVRLAKCDGAKKCLLTNNSPNNKQISCDGELCDRWTHWVCAKPKPLKKHQNRFFCEFCTGKGQRKRNERAAQLEEDRENAEFMTDESSVQSDSGGSNADQ